MSELKPTTEESIRQTEGERNMRTPIERETALIFAAAMLMQDVVHNKALDRPARDKIREAALTLKEMADEVRDSDV